MIPISFFFQPVKALPSHHPIPPTYPSLHPSFALLLSPAGNYLHKSFFALWFAPFHKWRLSLFNRAGFASHVKAYNVAGPRFSPRCPLLTVPQGPEPPGRDTWGARRGGRTPRLRLTGPEEASVLVDQPPDSLTWLKGGGQDVVKNHLCWKGLRICCVCPPRTWNGLSRRPRRWRGRHESKIRDRLFTPSKVSQARVLLLLTFSPQC